MSFPKYPKYKASGVEWLGDVPAGWEVSRLKRVCHVFPSNVDKKSHDGETPVKLCNYTDVYYQETITADMEFMAATASTEQIAKFTLRAGDTIITKDSETSNDIAIGAYVPADLPGVVCGYHLSMIRPMAKTNGAFIKRLFDSVYVKGCVEVRANGLTRVGLGQYEIDNLDLPFPPLAEQVAIAAFLDRETAKIDGLVAEQKRLMELLKEKRQAVISHAVTKGLNPNAKMKPSGIEWLGDVPEHWAVRRLKNLVEEPLKYGANESAELDDRTLPRFVRITDIDDSGGLRDDTFKSLPEIVAEPYLLKEGDVLLARSGATVGKSFIYSMQWGPACFAGYLIRARLNQKVCLAQWLYYFCQTDGYWGYVIGSQIQATIQNVSAEKYANLYLPVPPLAEQVAIAAFLDRETARFDTLTAEAQRAIDLLQERRTALISAAVTGQIDVRNITTKETA